ncbi:MAG: ankyrin repeat domain-containing protein [Thermoguttaceae bacterium]
MCKAIEAKDIPKIDKLVAEGADVNAKGRGNMTPLLWAFPENKPEVFKRILEHGGDPNVEVTSDFNTKNQGIRSGDSVLFLAATTSFHNYFKYVMEHGGNPNAIRGSKYKDSVLIAVISGNAPNKTESVQLLIDAGADLDYVDQTDGTAVLMAASWGGQFDIALDILNAGASYNLCKDNGGTFLHFILKNKKFIKQRYSEKQSQDYDAIIKFLESRGADLEGAEKDNAIYLSGGRLSPKRIKELKKRYADELEAKKNVKEEK